MGHWVWTLGKVGLGKQTAKRRSGGVTLLLTDIRVDEKAEALKVRLIGRRMSRDIVWIRGGGRCLEEEETDERSGLLEGSEEEKV